MCVCVCVCAQRVEQKKPETKGYVPHASIVVVESQTGSIRDDRAQKRGYVKWRQQGESSLRWARGSPLRPGDHRLGGRG